jgi:hypothetical protein
MEASAPPNRVLAIILGALAAGCLLFAAFTHAWLINDSTQEPLSYGLTSVVSCSESSSTVDGSGAQVPAGECERESLSDHIERISIIRSTQHATSFAFQPAGLITAIACLLAAAGLLLATAMALARWRPTLPITPTTIALVATMIGLVAGCVFVMAAPTLGGLGLGVGFSFYVFGPGCILGLATCRLLARVNRPPDPDLLEDAMNPDQF